jgi:hypothetical protein
MAHRRSATAGAAAAADGADVTVQWRWTLGSLVTAVAGAGLRITHLVEAGDASEKSALPAGAPGRFTLRATKEGTACPRP